MTQKQLFDHLWDVVTTQTMLDRRAGLVPRARAMDAAPTGYKPYHRCGDGILRTDEMRKSWERNGYWDELNRLRGDLRAKHCGDVDRSKVRAGHLCSCEAR